MNQTYFYKAYIMRSDRRVCREGTIQAVYPDIALDKIVGLAVNEWKRPLLKIELFEIDAEGTLVATSTVQDRIGAVIESNRALGSKKFEALSEALDKRKDKTERKALPPPPEKTVARSVPVTSTDWVFKVGTYEQAPVFATLKLNEGAFK
jgi:hypothetical protein